MEKLCGPGEKVKVSNLFRVILPEEDVVITLSDIDRGAMLTRHNGRPAIIKAAVSTPYVS